MEARLGRRAVKALWFSIISLTLLTIVTLYHYEILISIHNHNSQETGIFYFMIFRYNVPTCI